MEDSYEFDFPEEGVKVTVPAHDPPFVVKKLEPDDPSSMPPDTEEFQSHRQVIKIEVVFEDYEQEYLQEFGVDLELQVRYTYEDQSSAQQHNLEYPLLAFWDGSDWVIFEEEKHSLAYYPDKDPETGGYALVKFSAWADPPIHWGP